MGSSSDVFKTVVLESSTWAVVRTDPAQPRLMEVIANFYDEKRARDYTDLQNGQMEQPHHHKEQGSAEASAPARTFHKPDVAEAELSSRQSSVLKALRDKMDETKHVAVRAAVLAQSAQIPLGSLHSVLGSLEKKGLIQTSRAGSARAPAVYRVL
jgi:hypothetical protein